MYVLVKTEADLATPAQAWHPVVDEYFENTDEAHDDEGFVTYGPVRTPCGLVFGLSDLLTPSVCLQRFVGLLNRTGLQYGYNWPRPSSNQIAPYLSLRLITERGAVPDAFGIQLLDPSLAATGHPTDLRWVSTQLDTGHLLLEHRDIEAWYANPQPDSAAINQARIDLAAFIRPEHQARSTE